jgi:hypothetical protein
VSVLVVASTILGLALFETISSIDNAIITLPFWPAWGSAPADGF